MSAGGAGGGAGGAAAAAAVAAAAAAAETLETVLNDNSALLPFIHVVATKETCLTFIAYTAFSTPLVAFVASELGRH